MRGILRATALAWGFLAVLFAPQQSQAQTPSLSHLVPVTILHTNDIHSHFRPDKDVYGLGGIARLSTAINRIRDQVPHTVLLDGGDFSEGHVYYNLGGGRASVEMMNHLGYDAIVVGNHDWLNGPDQLLDLLNQTPARFALLSANLNYSRFARGSELSQKILPYTIIARGPARIAVIGASTYEHIYDRYFGPVRIEAPFPAVRRLAAKLKTKDHVDAVIVISHNGYLTNRALALLPHIDIVIHAHDHEKYSAPVAVSNSTGKTAYLVEAEKWGHYLGRLDLLVDPVKHSVTFDPSCSARRCYELIQIDGTIPDDPAVEAMVNRYDAELAAMYRSLGEPHFFTERLTQNEVSIDKSGGRENLIGNLAADAYRAATGADVAFEQIQLTSGTLEPGWITPLDVLNAVIQVFNPATLKTWTLRTVTMTGDTLRRIAMLMYVIQDLVPGGMPSVSGMRAVFDPAVTDSVDVSAARARTPGGLNGVDDDAPQGVRLIEIGGQPVELSREYKVAVSLGLLHSIEFLEGWPGYRIDRSNVQDTGIEGWRAIRDYLARQPRVTERTLNIGARFQIMQSDSAIYPHDISVERLDSGRFRVEVEVHNYGMVRSLPRRIRIGYDQTPKNRVDDPSFTWARDIAVPAIEAGGSTRVETQITLPGALASETFVPFRAELKRDAPSTASRGPSAMERDGYPGNDTADRVWVAPQVAASAVEGTSGTRRTRRRHATHRTRRPSVAHTHGDGHTD